MIKCLITALILTVVSTSIAIAEEFLPSTIFQLDKKFNHHVLIVEKNTHSLYLYKYDESDTPKLINTFKVATGKMIGDKEVQGDKKTPEGIYIFRRFYSAQDLIKKYGKTGLIYGAGAFTMNYPNEIDRRERKTGGGIWLHSTDDDARVNKGLDSRGCVVATDTDIKDISEYIELDKTSTVIVQDLTFLKKKTWEKKKKNITTFLTSWMKAWQEKDFNEYINGYSTENFMSSRGNFYAYRNYKRAVFARADRPEIKFNHISILNHSQYAVVTFEQDYKSSIIKDVGKKVLYLQQDKNYDWKIVAEKFKKIERTEQIKKFTPSQRFFTEKISNVSSTIAEGDYDSESI